jgi:Amt family ammonium transporter
MTRRRLCGIAAVLLLLACGSSVSMAQEESATAAATPAAPVLNSGDIAWMLTSSALVLMMTAPGLAMFYSGLVRKKNVLGVMMQCIFLMGLLSVVWALWGYSLAFGGANSEKPLNAYIGNTDYLFLKGVYPTDAQPEPTPYPVAGTIPPALFMVYQMMFFIITPALICGAFAERMKFSTMCVFCVLWGTFIYCPVAHWVWAPSGWLFKKGALDFAGGTVVHLISGLSALICALVIGKRLGFGQEPMPPHNLTYTTIGAALLWVGWFGFNAGSAVSSSPLAVSAFVSTHLATAAGVLAWSGAEWLARGKPSILGACSGAVAGLVCITPAAGFVNPLYAMVMGLAGGGVCYFACTTVKNKFKYDDALDAFGVHGVGGTLGAILTGVFAMKAINPALIPSGYNGGLVDGNPGQVVTQLYGVVASAVLAVVGTIILLKVLDAVMGLRVSQEEEIQGLDLSQHGEEGYIFT